MPLPWMPEVIRHLLLSRSPFIDLIAASRVGFTAPADVTTEFVIIQAPGGASLSGDDVAWSPLVQVDGYWPASDPAAAKKAWDLAAGAATVLGRARNLSYANVTYSARLTDGPIPDVDTSRGPSSILHRALIRAELRLHSR